ncbi:MAG: Yip1 family protein [Gammaproteobacteria bacterium]
MNVFAVLFSPERGFAAMGKNPPKPLPALFTAAWLGLIPPACAYAGASKFGWRLGVGEPVPVPPSLALTVSVAYYLFLLGGFVFAAFLMRWMAPTYGARANWGASAAFLAAAGAPLMLGGAAHLYPHLGLNLMLLAPAMMWSAYLLYSGLPAALGTNADRGMLMATSMLGVFFTAACALMTGAMLLWTLGIGPDIGFNWRFSVTG